MGGSQTDPELPGTKILRNLPRRQESNPTASAPDGALVATARSGNLGAFEVLVRRYQDRVFNLAYRLTGSLEEAEDAAQETFMKAHRALGGFRGTSGFYTWLYRIAVNTCHSRGRQTTRRRSMEGISIHAGEEEGVALPEPEAANGAPEKDLLAEERRRAVQEALLGLGPELREVVLLRDMEGLSYAQIAEALSITTAAVRSRLHRARTALAGRLKDVALP